MPVLVCRFRSELCEFSASAMVNEGDRLVRRQGANALPGGGGSAARWAGAGEIPGGPGQLLLLFFVIAGLVGEGRRSVSHSCVSLHGTLIASGSDAECLCFGSVLQLDTKNSRTRSNQIFGCLTVSSADGVKLVGKVGQSI